MKSVWRPFLALIVLPNALFAAASLAGAQRALVNLDYLVLAALYPLIGRSLLMIVAGLVVACDVAFTFAPAFNFGPAETLDAIEQIRHFSGRAVLVACGVLALIAIIAVGMVLLAGRSLPAEQRARYLRMLGVATLAAIVVDVANGSSVMLWRARTALGVDVTQSMMQWFASGAARPPEHGEPMESATTALRDAVEAARANGGAWRGPEKIVLVMVEAMGYPKGASLEDLFRPLMTDAISRRYIVRTGSVPFVGPTTSGEFREICGRRLSHFTARTATLDGCMPAQLKALGFETVALHAYTLDLFERRAWYPRVGFQRTRFQEDLRASLPQCGVMFRGVCDSAMTSLVRQEIAAAPRTRQFTYWLTLTSHFPLDPRAEPSDAVCRTLGSAGREAEVCRLWTTLYPALTGMAAIAADSSVPPAWYVIVGDHAPSQLFSRSELYHQDRVPFIELRPR